MVSLPHHPPEKTLALVQIALVLLVRWRQCPYVRRTMWLQIGFSAVRAPYRALRRMLPFAPQTPLTPGCPASGLICWIPHALSPISRVSNLANLYGVPKHLFQQGVRVLFSILFWARNSTVLLYQERIKIPNSKFQRHIIGCLSAGVLEHISW